MLTESCIFIDESKICISTFSYVAYEEAGDKTNYFGFNENFLLNKNNYSIVITKPFDLYKKNYLYIEKRDNKDKSFIMNLYKKGYVDIDCPEILGNIKIMYCINKNDSNLYIAENFFMDTRDNKVDYWISSVKLAGQNN